MRPPGIRRFNLMNTPTSSNHGFFLDRPEVYDAMIDWPARLKREEPLYRWLFQQVHAHRVLDTACGSGRHAALFYSWGLEVVGADISPAMIALCRDTHGEPAGLQWRCRSFAADPEGEPSFDAVLCKGNSLALAPDLDTVTRAIQTMMHALRPGGVCLIQLLNLHRLPRGPTQWQKKQRITLDDMPCLLLKGIHHHQDGAYLETVLMQENSHPPGIESHTERLLQLEQSTLSSLLLEHGAEHLQSYGTVNREPFHPEKSPDLILVARKA